MLTIITEGIRRALTPPAEINHSLMKIAGIGGANNRQGAPWRALYRFSRESRITEDRARFLNDANGPNALSKISRYEAAIWRSIYRTLHELQRLQAARSGAEVSAPAVVDLNVDVSPPVRVRRR